MQSIDRIVVDYLDNILKNSDFVVLFSNFGAKPIHTQCPDAIPKTPIHTHSILTKPITYSEPREVLCCILLKLNKKHIVFGFIIHIEKKQNSISKL